MLIVETDTYSAMADLFSLTLSDSNIEKVKQFDGLEVVNLYAEDALVHAIKQFVPSDRVARSVIGSYQLQAAAKTTKKMASARFATWVFMDQAAPEGRR